MIPLPKLFYTLVGLLLLMASSLALASVESAAPTSAETAHTAVFNNVKKTEPAPEEAPIASSAAPSVDAGFNDLLQMIFSFSLVIGALVLMLWAMKRWQPKLAAGRGGLSVKAALSLGGRDRLIVIQAGERELLLGVSPGNITLLGDYDELLPSASAAEEKAPSSSAVDAFQKLLKR